MSGKDRVHFEAWFIRQPARDRAAMRDWSRHDSVQVTVVATRWFGYQPLTRLDHGFVTADQMWGRAAEPNGL